MTEWSVPGRVWLHQDGRTMTWEIVMTLPECEHPEQEQLITPNGTRCGVCGYVQEPCDTEVTR